DRGWISAEGICFDTLTIIWVGKYLLLLAALVLAAVWSLVRWFTKRSRTERHGDFRNWLKVLPGELALLIALGVAFLAMHWLEKNYGVPFGLRRRIVNLSFSVWRTR